MLPSVGSNTSIGDPSLFASNKATSRLGAATTGSLNVITRLVPIPTLVAPLLGAKAVITGGVTSGASATTNRQVVLSEMPAKGFSNASRKASASILTKYVSR